MRRKNKNKNPIYMHKCIKEQKEKKLQKRRRQKRTESSQAEREIKIRT
jgi:hypothetical protein